MKLIVELKKWLEKSGNSRTLLASQLNYKSTATIEKWLSKGEVPRREEDRVRNIIRKPTEEKA